MAQLLVLRHKLRHKLPGALLTFVRRAALLTAGNVVSVGCEPYEILLVDVTLEGAQAVRLPYVPQLQLTVC